MQTLERPVCQRSVTPGAHRHGARLQRCPAARGRPQRRSSQPCRAGGGNPGETTPILHKVEGFKSGVLCAIAGSVRLFSCQRLPFCLFQHVQQKT